MNNRGVSLAILIGLTVFFGYGASQARLETIFSDLLPANHPFVKAFQDHPGFGNPLTVTLMVKRKDGDIYNPETLAKVWKMTRDIDLVPGVDHDQILSITTEKARYAEATPFGIDTQPLMGDHPPATPEEIQEFIHRVKMSPNTQKFLISGDNSATIIKATFIERLLDYGVIFKEVQALAARERDEHHDIYVAGQPILTGWVYEYEYQMLGIFAITGALLVLSLILYMRNVAGVVTPLIASITSAIWGFGLVGWIKHPIEPLIMVVPLLLIARSFSHAVQVTERYYEIYHHVKDKKKAAEIALSVMMTPGVLGILTDVFGLLLIAVAPIPTMQRFALFCGFWALTIIPCNVFLSPLVLSLVPEPKNVRKMIAADGLTGIHGQIKRGLARMATITYGRRARVTTVIVAIIALVSVYLTLQLKVGNPVEGSSLLWPDDDYNVAVRTMNAHFPGLNTLEVIFEAKDQGNPDRMVRQAEPIFTMLKLQRLMEEGKNPPVATLSFGDYLPEANRLFSGGNPKWGPLDNNKTAVEAAAGAVLFGSSPTAFSGVTDFVMQNGTVSLWYKDNKQETVDMALEKVRGALEKIGLDHDNFRIRLGSGSIALQQSINDTVDTYQYIILGCLNIVILIICWYAYHSFVAGVLLLIPVNLSNFVLGAMMERMGIGLDVNTLPIAAIGIGVGIDYGIYLLSRMCEEYQGHPDYSKAILTAISTTGKAIFFTAMIVLLAILPWYFLSGLKFLADMGLLLVLVMSINMLIALIVLPLLVWLMKPKFLGSDKLLVGEGVDLSAYVADDAEIAALQGGSGARG